MLDKDPSTMGNMFDRIAPSYDRLNRILSLNIDRSWRRRAIRALAIEDGDCVLDIATGTGDLAMAALSRRSCTIVGIDLSLEMIALASQKSRSRGHSRRTLFVAGDALAVPLKNGSMHRAMAAFGIRNMKSLEGFFEELHRVLVDGGRVVILEFSLPENRILRGLYLAYFKGILPFVGGALSGNFSAYRYLTESVLDFPSPAELALLMNRCGFGVLASRRLSRGIVHLFVLEKGSAPSPAAPPGLYEPRQADKLRHAPGLGDAP